MYYGEQWEDFVFLSWILFWRGCQCLLASPGEGFLVSIHVHKLLETCVEFLTTGGYCFN